MRAELANIYPSAVPFLSRAAANLCFYYIINDNRNLPWFDVEVHKLCMKKERLRLKSSTYSKASSIRNSSSKQNLKK